MKPKQKYIRELANAKGIYHIFAIDHRDVFVNALTDKLQHKATFSEIVSEKNRLMKSVSTFASGYLIDPIYGKKEHRLLAELDGQPFMMGIENNNYNVNLLDDDYLYKDISALAIKELGGSMVKLFVYDHPHMEFHKKIKEIVLNVSKECEANNIPFLLEPILYKGDDMQHKERYKLTIEMLNEYKGINVDIFKLEFPGDIGEHSEQENIAFAKQISEQIQCPWIVLSSGVTPELFVKQIELSGKGGASGYAVGRSVWKNFIHATDEQLHEMADIMSKFAACADLCCKSIEEREVQ